MGLGTIPSALGVPWYFGMILGAAAVFLLVRFLGRPVDDVAAAGEALA